MSMKPKMHLITKKGARGCWEKDSYPAKTLSLPRGAVAKSSLGKPKLEVRVLS